MSADSMVTFGWPGDLGITKMIFISLIFVQTTQAYSIKVWKKCLKRWSYWQCGSYTSKRAWVQSPVRHGGHACSPRARKGRQGIPWGLMTNQLAWWASGKGRGPCRMFNLLFKMYGIWRKTSEVDLWFPLALVYTCICSLTILEHRTHRYTRKVRKQ